MTLPAMDYIAKAKTVMDLEIAEIKRLSERVDEAFGAAVEALRETVEGGGKIVVCGVGKSGNIGHKLAATFNSTGATAVVLHSQNALHGDLGMVSGGDVVIALSYQGETNELIDLLPHVRRAARTVIALTGNPDSTLAQNSDIVLDVNVQREACPLNLAPTSSSTVMLVLGDALAMVLLEARGFREEDFAQLHPGGSLGRTLLTKVSQIMRSGDRLPLVSPETPVREALEVMTRCRSGATVVASPDGRLEGIFTQGDFARAFQKIPDLADRSIDGFMTRDPVSIGAEKLAVEVLKILESHPIDDLVVTGEDGTVQGLVDIQDLSRLRIL